MKKIIISLLALLISTACAKENFAFKGTESINDATWGDYQTILNKVVKARQYESINGVFCHNGVNYQLLREDQDLKDKVDQQAKVLTTVKVPEEKKAKLAFWMNAYNFFTLLELQRNPKVKSMKKLGWKNKRLNVSGALVSLDQIEHKLIRPLKDPRIHFAINCASVGCPSLGKFIFTSATVDTQLNALTKEALRNPLHIRPYSDSAVATTKLFSWFSGDFKVQPYGSLKGFVKVFAPKAYHGKKIKTKISYDWDMNTVENVDAKIKKLAKEFPDLKITLM